MGRPESLTSARSAMAPLPTLPGSLLRPETIRILTLGEDRFSGVRSPVDTLFTGFEFTVSSRAGVTGDPVA